MTIGNECCTEVEIVVTKNGAVNKDVPLITVEGDCFLEIMAALGSKNFNRIRSLMYNLQKRMASEIAAKKV